MSAPNFNPFAAAGFAPAPTAPAEGAEPAAGALPPPSSAQPAPPPGFTVVPPPPGMFSTAAPLATRTMSEAEAADRAEEEAEREEAATAAEEAERAARLRARARRLELEAEIRRVDPWFAEQSRANSLRQNARRTARREARRAGITDPEEIERLADEAAERVPQPAPTVPHGRHEGNGTPASREGPVPMDAELRREVDRKRRLLAARSVDAVMIDEAPSLAEVVVGLARQAETDQVRFRAASYVVDRASAAGRALDLGDLAAEIAGMTAARAIDAVALAVLEGRISRDDGEFALKLCEARVAALSIDDLLGRIDQLQARIADLAAKSAVAPARE